MRAGGNRIVCEPSYVPVENLVFGRLAFKGFFPCWHWRNVKQSDTLIVPPPLFTTSCCRDECRNWGDDGGKQGGDGGEPGGSRCVSGGDGDQVGFGYNHTSDKVRKEITSRSVPKGLCNTEPRLMPFIAGWLRIWARNLPLKGTKVARSLPLTSEYLVGWCEARTVTQMQVVQWTRFTNQKILEIGRFAKMWVWS